MTSPYHTATGFLICRINEWTGFYMTATSVLKELTSEYTREVKEAYLGFYLMSVTEAFFKITVNG